MRRTAGTLLAVLVAAVALTAGHTSTVPPCAHEDSPGPCVWDAQQQGNGHGNSFTVNTDGSLTPFEGK